jgi:DNA-binding LacI/PurR family transcriptional regulator
MDTDEQPDRERAALSALAAGRVDGIILCPSSNDDTTVRAIQRRTGLPIVLFDNTLDGVGAGGVTLANEAGVRLLVDHLAQVHRHRRIGYVGGIETETAGAERLAGYRAGMAANDLPVESSWVRPGDWTEPAGRTETAALLERPARSRVSAIVYPSADLALGGLAELRARGVRVPADVAIVSFDDTGFGPLLDPPLTALARRDREIGDLAAALVLGALDGADPGSGRTVRQIRIPMELAVRRSCGCSEERR